MISLICFFFKSQYFVNFLMLRTLAGEWGPGYDQLCPNADLVLCHLWAQL